MSQKNLALKYVTKHGYFYQFARIFIILLAYVFYHPKFKGLEKVPKDGPMILVAAPHRHLPDAGFVCLCTRRSVHFLAKKELFHSFFFWVFQLAECIPVDRSAHDGSVIEGCCEVLNANNVIAIFPEGTRNKTSDVLLPFRFGAVSMAQKTQAQIVPIGLKADYRPFIGHYQVNVGDCYTISKEADLEKENAILRNKLLQLMEE